VHSNAGKGFACTPLEKGREKSVLWPWSSSAEKIAAQFMF